MESVGSCVVSECLLHVVSGKWEERKWESRVGKKEDNKITKEVGLRQPRQQQKRQQ